MLHKKVSMDYCKNTRKRGGFYTLQKLTKANKLTFGVL